MRGRGRSLTIAMAAALASWSCGSTAPSATPDVAQIVVSPSTSTLAPNAQLPLRAQVQDGSGEIVPDAAVTWTVQDPSIVSISDAGVVTALAAGTSQVAANALGKSGLAVITVTPEPANPGNVDPGTSDAGADGASPVATVRVTAPAKKVKPGATMQLVATAIDGDGNTVRDQTFFWSSSNPNTATVSESGVVSGKRRGDVTITARTAVSDGQYGSVDIEVK